MLVFTLLFISAIITLRRAVTTYNGQGLEKSGIRSDEHALIYSTKDPTPELPVLSKKANDPIAVRLNSAKDKLERGSCVNYAKIYNVEHNVKVYFLGSLTDSARKRVLLAVNDAWQRNTSSSQII